MGINKVIKSVHIVVNIYSQKVRNKVGICIPNSTTEVWTVVDVDLLIDISIQLDQHVSSNDTLHQDLIGCGSGLVFILDNQ